MAAAVACCLGGDCGCDGDGDGDGRENTIAPAPIIAYSRSPPPWHLRVCGVLLLTRLADKTARDGTHPVQHSPHPPSSLPLHTIHPQEGHPLLAVACMHAAARTLLLLCQHTCSLFQLPPLNPPSSPPPYPPPHLFVEPDPLCPRNGCQSCRQLVGCWWFEVVECCDVLEGAQAGCIRVIGGADHGHRQTSS